MHKHYYFSIRYFERNCVSRLTQDLGVLRKTVKCSKMKGNDTFISYKTVFPDIP